MWMGVRPLSCGCESKITRSACDWAFAVNMSASEDVGLLFLAFL